MSLDEAVRFLLESHAALAFGLLFGAAFLEYIFPPFPGDTVTLAGAVLVTAYGHPFLAVFVPVIAGGLAGGAVDFAIGRAIARGSLFREDRLGIARRARSGLDRVSAAFLRHGEAYVAINRFLPGVRAFVFVAAGLAGMRFARVMLFALASGVAWNLLIIGLGMAVGSNLETIERVFRGFGIGVWIALAVVALVLVGRAAWRRRAAAEGRKE